MVIKESEITHIGNLDHESEGIHHAIVPTRSVQCLAVPLGILLLVGGAERSYRKEQQRQCGHIAGNQVVELEPDRHSVPCQRPINAGSGGVVE